MGWVLASLGSSVIFAGISVLDKRILAAHVPGLSGFYILVGALQVAMAAIAVLAVPWEGGASVGAVMAAAISGVLWGLTLLLFFYSLRILEVSRAVPIFHTYPVFVALMAVVFLEERLPLIHWAAILVVVGGAGLVTLGQDKRGEAQRMTMAFALLFLASILTAGAIVATKAAVEEMNLWNVFALRSLFLGAVLLLPVVWPHGLQQVRTILANGRSVSLIFVTEGILAGAGVYIMLLALSLGPASLASTLMSTRPVFVLIISTLLSTRFWNLLDEPLTRDALTLKVASTVMVVGGASVLSLV